MSTDELPPLAAAMVERGRAWNVTVASTGEQLFLVVAESEEEALRIALPLAERMGLRVGEMRVSRR